LLGNFRDLIVVSTSLCLRKFCQAQGFPKGDTGAMGVTQAAAKQLPNTGLNQELPLPVMLLPLTQC